LDFNKRLTEAYPELYSETTEGATDARSAFGRKWGSYQEIDVLSESKVGRIIGVPSDKPVTEYPLHGCLMYLAYVKELAEFNNRMIKQKFN
jgi:hypothetical protein